MKSQELFNKIIHPVSCKFGAPLGRYSDSGYKRPKNQKLFDRKVLLDSGAYDKGGAYWGFPNNLRVQYNKDLTFVYFYRSYEAIK